MKSNHLSKDYSYKADGVARDAWDRILHEFKDASIYQTWSYGAIRWGNKNLSHLILKKKDKIVSAAQLRLIKTPLINRGIAYLTWGPVWRKIDGNGCYEDIEQMLRALVIEYAKNRKLMLRIRPNVIDKTRDGDQIKTFLNNEGFEWKAPYHRTIMVDLQNSVDDLRQNLKPKWRKKLRKAEKSDLTVQHGTDDGLYGDLCKPYNEMVLRKKFTPGLDINEFRSIQADLSDPMKMDILTCSQNGHVIGSILASRLGNKGIFILGGSNTDGLKLGASHLLPWRMILWMKESGAKWCDLGGYNPDKNPGTGYFKEGFGGEDIRHIGEFEIYGSITSRYIVKSGERIYGSHGKDGILDKTKKHSLSKT